MESRRSSHSVLTNHSLGKNNAPSDSPSWSSRTSIVTSRPSPPSSNINVSSSNTQDVVWTTPVAPCIVLFAHKAPCHNIGDEDLSRSFLIIDSKFLLQSSSVSMKPVSSQDTHEVKVTAEVTLNEELTESEHTYAPSFQCVLEKKGSYLPARRSLETNDAGMWDLSAASLYKREAEMGVVKRLKHVIIQFDNQTSRFCTKLKL